MLRAAMSAPALLFLCLGTKRMRWAQDVMFPANAGARGKRST